MILHHDHRQQGRLSARGQLPTWNGAGKLRSINNSIFPSSCTTLVEAGCEHQDTGSAGGGTKLAKSSATNTAAASADGRQQQQMRHAKSYQQAAFLPMVIALRLQSSPQWALRRPLMFAWCSEFGVVAPAIAITQFRIGKIIQFARKESSCDVVAGKGRSATTDSAAHRRVQESSADEAPMSK